jgi:hypothetical protein
MGKSRYRERPARVRVRWQVRGEGNNINIFGSVLKKGSALNKVDRQGDEGISIVQQTDCVTATPYSRSEYHDRSGWMDGLRTPKAVWEADTDTR